MYILACLVGLWRLWGYEEKINKTELSFPDLVSPKNVIDSLKATFRKRHGHKNIYILSLTPHTLTNVLYNALHALVTLAILYK